MRAFIAIPLPPVVLKRLAQWQKILRSAAGSLADGRSEVKWAKWAKWVRPEGIHLTLKFLGEIDAAKTKQVIAALAAPSHSFKLEVKELGCFPNCKRPHVLWAGVSAPPDLLDLAAGVETAMRRLNFPSEDRPFSPHLTLARIADKRPQSWIEAAVRQGSGWTTEEFEVSEYCLFESLLSPGAPAQYRRVASFAVPASEASCSQPVKKD